MKILIKDTNQINRESELVLYSADGKEFAEDFILLFSDNGAELLDDGRKVQSRYKWYTMTKESFNRWVEILNRQQNIIDSAKKFHIDLPDFEGCSITR